MATALMSSFLEAADPQHSVSWTAKQAQKQQVWLSVPRAWQGALPADSTGYWNYRGAQNTWTCCSFSVRLWHRQVDLQVQPMFRVCGRKGGGSAVMEHCSAHCCVRVVCTRVGTLIVETIYLQLIQNRYMFRSFTVLHCSHQHCVQPVASDVEVV